MMKDCYNLQAAASAAHLSGIRVFENQLCCFVFEACGDDFLRFSDTSIHLGGIWRHTGCIERHPECIWRDWKATGIHGSPLRLNFMNFYWFPLILEGSGGGPGGSRARKFAGL